MAIGVVAVTAADAPGTVEGVDVVGTVGTVVRGDKVVSGVVAPAGSRVTMVSPRPAEGSAVVVVVGLMMKAAVNGCVLGVVGSGGVVVGASVDAGAVVIACHQAHECLVRGPRFQQQGVGQVLDERLRLRVHLARLHEVAAKRQHHGLGLRDLQFAVPVIDGVQVNHKSLFTTVEP